ncbi:MAG: helix-turn-helix domain-containing protein [Actinomycetota bacterium]|nr:MAG: helix-turn-helix domain-containing protein [Actinomycetota bacterium]
MTNLPAILTAEEVGELLRLSPATIRRLAETGELPGRKLGKVWRFSSQAIEHHLWESQ